MGVTAYFDDSGTDKDNPVLIVAGFVSTDYSWDVLNEEWVAAESEFGSPPFHAKIFNDGRKGHGVYKDWTKPKREDYINRLLGIISRRTLKSFATALNKDGYQIIDANQPLKEYFYSPFVFASVNCIFQVCDWRNQHYPGEPIRFVFDHGHKNLGQLIDGVAKRVLIGSDHLVSDVSSDDDRNLPPLRAADLLAFEMCVEARVVANDICRDTRYPLLRLDEHPHEWLEINKDNMFTRIAELFRDGTFGVRPD